MSRLLDTRHVILIEQARVTLRQLALDEKLVAALTAGRRDPARLTAAVQAAYDASRAAVLRLDHARGDLGPPELAVTEHREVLLRAVGQLRNALVRMPGTHHPREAEISALRRLLHLRGESRFPALHRQLAAALTALDPHLSWLPEARPDLPDAYLTARAALAVADTTARDLAVAEAAHREASQVSGRVRNVLRGALRALLAAHRGLGPAAPPLNLTPLLQEAASVRRRRANRKATAEPDPATDPDPIP